MSNSINKDLKSSKVNFSTAASENKIINVYIHGMLLVSSKKMSLVFEFQILGLRLKIVSRVKSHLISIAHQIKRRKL